MIKVTAVALDVNTIPNRVEFKCEIASLYRTWAHHTDVDGTYSAQIALDPQGTYVWNIEEVE